MEIISSAGGLIFTIASVIALVIALVVKMLFGRWVNGWVIECSCEVSFFFKRRV